MNWPLDDYGPLSQGDSRNAKAHNDLMYGLSPVFVVMPLEIPVDWALKPSGLEAGDRFRLLFLSSTTRNAESTDIADYNSYIAPPEVSEPRILDAIGNASGSFSDQAVRNNTHPGAPRTSTISEPDVPHGSTLDTATVLTLGAAVSGRIDPGGDEDYFKIELAKAAGLLVRTTGGLDTTGELLDSNGALIASNDDGRPGEDANFVIWQSLPAGAYYIKVGGYQAAAGLYELHTGAIPDTSSRADGSVCFGCIAPNSHRDFQATYSASKRNLYGD